MPRLAVGLSQSTLLANFVLHKASILGHYSPFGKSCLLVYAKPNYLWCANTWFQFAANNVHPAIPIGKGATCTGH